MDRYLIGRKRKSEEKPLCQFGASCYRKNPEHLKKFKHPPKKDKDSDRNSLNDTHVGTSEESETDGSQNIDSGVETLESEADVSQSNEETDVPKDIEADPESDVNGNNPNDVKHEETVEEILKIMPKDFFDFYNFCSTLNSLSPRDAFSDFGYTLVGVYDLLSRKLPKSRKVDILCHWRYYYDPPEFQTVIKKSGKDLYHIGYFRDDPSEVPAILASNSAAVNEKLTLMGDNIFCAMNIELTKILKSSKSESTKKKVSVVQEKLLKFASEKKYSIKERTKKTKERQENVVAKTFHGLGIVVPVIRDVGYRPLPESDATIRKILMKIASAGTEDERLEEEEKLDELITNVHFANDECDYGMGLELGIDLFCFGDPSLHKAVEGLLTLAYNLLKRPKYASIIKAHLKNRKKGEILRTLGV